MTTQQEINVRHQMGQKQPFVKQGGRLGCLVPVNRASGRCRTSGSGVKLASATHPLFIQVYMLSEHLKETHKESPVLLRYWCCEGARCWAEGHREEVDDGVTSAVLTRGHAGNSRVGVGVGSGVSTKATVQGKAPSLVGPERSERRLWEPAAGRSCRYSSPT